MAEAEIRVVLLTGPDESALVGLATRVVEERLAACASIVPRVRSIYRWDGAVRDETEALAIVKTTAAAIGDLEARVHALHPYDVPEFLVLPVEGAAGYLEWVRSSVGQETSGHGPA